MMSSSGYVKVFAMFCVCISLVGCSVPQAELVAYTVPQQLAVTLQNDAEVLTETAAEELFTAPDYYAMPLLTKHEVVANENSLIAQFYFEKTASLAEINNARSFVITKFVLWQQSKLGGAPYDELVKRQAKPETIFCEIFLGDQLLLQDQYQGEAITLFEQLSTHCNLRALAQEDFVALTQPLQKQLPDAKIEVEKSLLGYCLIITAKSTKPVTTAQLEKAKSALADGFTQGGLPLAAYSGVVLRLTFDDKAYNETYLCSAENPRWVTDDWMNFSFISEAGNV